MTTILPMTPDEITLNRLIDEIFFLDENNEEDKKEIELINVQISRLVKNASGKAEWYITVIKEKQAIFDARVNVRKKSQKMENTALNSLTFIKQLAFDHMKAFDLKKVNGDFGTLSIRKGTQTVFYPENFDYSTLPDELRIHVPESFSPIKNDIKSLIKKGEDVCGLELITGDESLGVR